MSSLPVPPTTVNVLEGLPNQFTLPWRRFFQSQAPAGSGGGGGTPGPIGPAGPSGHIGPAGPPGPSSSSTLSPFDLIQIGKEGVTSITALSPLTGGIITSTGSVGLSTTAVTPGTYGDSTHVGRFTVDGFGRLTAASSVSISSTAWAPLVNGDLPGPTLVADPIGQCIMVPIG